MYFFEGNLRKLKGIVAGVSSWEPVGLISILSRI
jgi:hypothetical protein